MEAVLLDTDVFSYLARVKDPRGDAYRPVVAGKTVAVSFVTVGEIYFGIHKARWSDDKRDTLLQRLKTVVVVPYDIDICATYGKLKASMQETGIVVGDNDLWIASCAMRHSVPLISNNRKHFENIPDLQLISFAPEKVLRKPRSRKLFEADPGG